MEAFFKPQVNTAHISPVQNGPPGKGICVGNDDFYAQNEREDDKMLVNISIDDLNDEDEGSRATKKS